MSCSVGLCILLQYFLARPRACIGLHRGNAHSSQNGSSRARSQSDNGVAELMPCQDPSDVEDLSHTASTHTLLVRACYVLTCCSNYGG